MSMKGLIQIYCGDGKGKTTAAIGQAVRAAGCGIPVVIVRFLKNDRSGELVSLEKIPEIEVVPCDVQLGFVWNMNDEEKAEAQAACERLFAKARDAALKKAEEGEGALLVMDEIISTYDYGFVDREDFVNFLKNKPGNLEIVLTGRDPAPELTDLAGYVSEIKKIKHPYDKGINARYGIEY